MHYTASLQSKSDLCVHRSFIALIEDEIGGLFLSPFFHGKGLGKAMVDHAVTLKGSLRVEVFERNTIGRHFYDRYGFIETGRYRHEASGELTLKMACDIDSVAQT